MPGKNQRKTVRNWWQPDTRSNISEGIPNGWEESWACWSPGYQELWTGSIPWKALFNAIQKSLLTPGKGHGIQWTAEMKRFPNNCVSCMIRNLALLLMVWMVSHARKNVTLMNLSKMAIKKGCERSIRSIKFQRDKWERVFPGIILLIYSVSPDSELCKWLISLLKPPLQTYSCQWIWGLLTAATGCWSHFLPCR